MPYRMKNLLLFMFIFWSLCLTAQNKQDYVWLFGLGINPSTGEQTGYKFDFNEQPFEFEHQDIPIPIATIALFVIRRGIYYFSVMAA